MDEREDEGAYVRRLLHRWLVEYNPIYLLSASLCLLGMFLCSRSLAHESTGLLAVAGIAEAYGILLVLGAALLVRLNQKRPAVLLGLLCALYQGDLTLHTEACALLGTTGQLASAAWALLFLGKLAALSWALRLRISRGAWVVLGTGALGLSVAPHLFRELSPRACTAVIGVWLAALGTAAVYSEREITSRVQLDAWGTTVLGRARRAVWALWTLLLALHIGFWSLHVALEVQALLVVVALVATRHLRSEAQVWAVVVFALVLTGAFLPAHLALVAIASALTLAARARLHSVTEQVLAPATVSPIPYRYGDHVIRAAEPLLVTIRPTVAAQRRLVTGALFGGYLAMWTADWVGGAWPAHIVALDLVMAVIVVALLWRARIRISLLPLGAAMGHHVVQARVVTAPQSALAWGALSVSSGFVLLIVALAASYWLRQTEPTRK